MPRRETPGGDVDELARLLMAWVGLSMRISRGAESLRTLSDTGMTMAQVSAVHVLMFEGPQGVGDLAQCLGHSVSATSSLVQRLVEQGLVSRTEDPSDRRQKSVELTVAGKKLVERLMKARYRELRAGLEHIQAETRAELRRVIRRVVDELEAKVGEPAATTHTSKESKDTEAEP